jgi:hypothetical protein
MASPQSSSVSASSSQSLRDGLIAGSLVFALLVVFFVDFFIPTSPDSTSPVIVSESAEPPVEYTKINIAVTEPEFDDMGSLLTSLGSGYKYVTFDLDMLLDEDQMAKIDVLFLTCGGVKSTWVDQVVGNTDRGQRRVTLKEEIYTRAMMNLRKFVDRGGTLYSSDQRYMFIRDAFPEIASSEQQTGAEQTVEAEVVDAGLRELVGERIQLPFDKPSWYPAAFRQKDNVTVLMKGSFEGMDGQTSNSPLLVRFKYGEGVVIFTSFHNEKVNGEVAVKLLKYLVFATMLAKTEEKTAEIVTSGGLVAKGKSLLSASSAKPSVTQIYKCTKPSILRFVLGFEERGAKLKLTVESPQGKQEIMEGTSTFQIDIPEASVGNWKYTITAVKMPYDNFPYTLTVGSK